MSVVKLRLLLMGTLNKTVMKCRSFHSMQAASQREVPSAISTFTL